jgi:hypothetical protein
MWPNFRPLLAPLPITESPSPSNEILHVFWHFGFSVGLARLPPQHSCVNLPSKFSGLGWLSCFKLGHLLFKSQEILLSSATGTVICTVFCVKTKLGIVIAKYTRGSFCQLAQKLTGWRLLFRCSPPSTGPIVISQINIDPKNCKLPGKNVSLCTVLVVLPTTLLSHYSDRN